MTRRLLLVVLFLVAGVDVTVAVACLSAASAAQLLPRTWTMGLPPRHELRISAVSERDRLRWAKVAPAPVQFKVGTEKLVLGGFGMKVQHAPGTAQNGPNGWTVTDARLGWPLYVLQDWSWAETTLTNAQIESGQYFKGNTHFGHSLFPARPLLLGFVFNTLFYAAILWLLIPGPFVLRRFVRLRRGLCPKCAYPVGDSSVCTECGCELPSRVRVV